MSNQTKTIRKVLSNNISIRVKIHYDRQGQGQSKDNQGHSQGNQGQTGTIQDKGGTSKDMAGIMKKQVNQGQVWSRQECKREGCDKSDK